MTLIVVLKYKGGVAVVSDSQVTYHAAPLMREESPKIETVGNFAVTGVGLTGPLDRIFREIKMRFTSGPLPSFEHLVETCEDVTWAFYQKYAERIQEDEAAAKEGWNILLASCNRIFRVMWTGWSEEEAKYATDGSGDLYAEYILKQRYKPNISEREAKELAVHTLSQTSRIDPNVGGKICLYLIKKSGVRQVGDEELGKILDSVTEMAIGVEKELQEIVHEIVGKRRWINTVFSEKCGFELFEQNEFIISEISKSCRDEDDFTSRISALALMIDRINVSKLKKQISTPHLKGSINILETFLKEKYQGLGKNLIVNLRDIMTLRSKKMPIHQDDPRLIQVVLKWGQKIPPNWSLLWKQALTKYKDSLLELEKLLSS